MDSVSACGYSFGNPQPRTPCLPEQESPSQLCRVGRTRPRTYQRSRLNEHLGLGQRSHRLGCAQEILVMKPFLFHSLSPTSNLERKQKAPAETKTDGSIKASSILVSTGASLVVVSL